MCHCIFFGINPRVSKHHAFRLHRATNIKCKHTVAYSYLYFKTKKFVSSETFAKAYASSSTVLEIFQNYIFKWLRVRKIAHNDALCAYIPYLGIAPLKPLCRLLISYLLLDQTLKSVLATCSYVFYVEKNATQWFVSIRICYVQHQRAFDCVGKEHLFL